MYGQKTFHLLMIVVTHHDDHKIWGAADGTDELPFFWTTWSSIFVHLDITRMETSKSLMREFNTSGSYQTVVRLLEPYQNPHSWTQGHYRRSIKATIKAPTARNYEAIYTHWSKTNKLHKIHPKSTLIFRTFLLFPKNFHRLTLASKMLWQAPYWWPP